MTDVVPFAWVVPLSDLPADGRKILRTLTEQERSALACHANIEAVGMLTAKGEVRPWGGGVEVEIAFYADVIQTCVATLEPVSDRIEGAFIRHYLRGISEEETGVELVFGDEEPPEPLEGDAIDLSPALSEELILSLDPYPRAKGATLPAEAKDSDAAASPFAVLERLKPKS